VGGHGLLLEYIDGVNCREAKPLVDSRFFDKLRELLHAIRGAGVLHGDVKRNVLYSKSGEPVLVDLAASIIIPWWLAPLRNLVISTAAAYDEREVLKLKAQVAPQLVTDTDAQRLACRLPFEWLVHGVQELVQTCARALARRRV
jgi:hypothetical protein